MIKSLLVAISIFTAQLSVAEVKMGEFLGGVAVEVYPDWFKSSFLDLSDDIDDSIDSGRHVMVYFHQNNCPYCSKLVTDNFANESVIGRLKANFDVIETNMWGDREVVDLNGDEFIEKEYAAKMRVQFTPTIVFFDHNSRVVLRLNGYQSSDKLNTALDYVSGKVYNKKSFAQYLNSVKTKSMGTLTQNPVFEKGPHMLARNKGLPANKFLAVFFEENNCKECDIMHDKLMSLPATKELLSKFQVVRFNSQSDERLITPSGKKTTAKKWFDELKLTYHPSIVFFDKEGNEVIRKDAMFMSFHFQGLFTYLLTGSYKTQPSFQRYLEGKAEHIRKLGQDVDIWKY
jgi:thioredoxin-related protein